MKGSILISAGMILARVIGFTFSLVLARAFSPDSFGNIQYIIVLSGIVAIGTQPFVQHVLARFIGKYNGDKNRLEDLFANSWIILIFLFVLILLIVFPILVLLNKFNWGILIIFFGTTIFYTYWGLSRGFLASGRLITAYLGSNLIQLALVVILIHYLGIQSSILALTIYGLAYLVPVILLQIFRPFPVNFNFKRINWGTSKILIMFSIPIWLSHASFMIFISIDIILLEYFSDAAALGTYSLIKTISLIFILIPSGIGTLLMPRVASLRNSSHLNLLKSSLILSFFLNGVFLVVYLFFGQSIIERVFGPEYLTDPIIFLVLSIAMILIGTHSLITAVLVGIGKVADETISRVTAVATSIIAGYILVPIYQGLGAALAIFGGAVSALFVYGVIAIIRNRKEKIGISQT
jgi:O-antigen/teichoic acid export membrane protein